MPVFNEPILTSPRGLNANAGVGEAGVLTSNGTIVVYNVTTPPPGALAEGQGDANHNRAIQRYSLPGSPGAGPGNYLWNDRQIFVQSAPPAYALDFTVTLQGNAGANYAGHTGLVQVTSKSGRTWLCGMAPAASSSTRVVVVKLDLDDRGAGWTQTEFECGSGVVDTLNAFQHGIAYHGQLVACSQRNVIRWDPDLDHVTCAVADSAAASHFYARLFEIRDRLFWVGSTGSGDMRLNEILGSAGIRHHSFGTNNHGATGHWCGWVNGDTLYTFHYQADGGGQGIRHLVHAVPTDTQGDALSAPVDVSDPVIPPPDTQGTPGSGWPNETANWRYGATGPTIPDTRLTTAITNDNPSSGALSAQLIYFAFSANGFRECWSYAGTMGPMVQITPLGPPPDAITDDAFPVDDVGVGHRAFTEPAATLHRVVNLDDGNARLEFFMVTPATTTGWSLAFYYAQRGAPTPGPACRNKCELLPGSVTGVDQFATPATLNTTDDRVEDVTSEPNGGSPPPTLYTVIWDRNGQGVPSNLWAKVQAILEP